MASIPAGQEGPGPEVVAVIKIIVSALRGFAIEATASVKDRFFPPW